MTPTSPGAARVELAIGGMTCASCAARIEKKLNRMEGVEATVNYATEKARVAYAGEVSVDDLIATVEATGYSARRPAPPGPGPGNADGPGDGRAEDEPADTELRSLRQRLVTAAVLAVPVIAMAMVPALQFEYWQWLSSRWPRRSSRTPPGPSTAPPGPTPGTAPPPWTPSSRSVRRPRSCGRCGRSSSGPRAHRA